MQIIESKPTHNGGNPAKLDNTVGTSNGPVTTDPKGEISGIEITRWLLQDKVGYGKLLKLIAR
jgi:hypothetical protein